MPELMGTPYGRGRLIIEVMAGGRRRKLGREPDVFDSGEQFGILPEGFQQIKVNSFYRTFFLFRGTIDVRGPEIRPLPEQWKKWSVTIVDAAI